MMINPVGNSAYAEEADNSDIDYDGQIMATAATASTVNIAFNPTSANGTVTPVDASGAKAKVDVTATVRVQNSGGYSIYVGSSSSQLKAGSNVIDSVASSTTYENMPLNRWGYSFAQGTTASNAYNAMPATLRGTALYSNNSTNIKDETKTYTLSFAVNIGADKPAGTYTNQVTMSVVSSPLEIVNDFGITTMQEMTSAVCGTATDNDNDGQISAQLEDVRDGKYYWVAKLADGKCWMTQNLDLDLGTSWPDANLSDYEVATQDYLPVQTQLEQTTTYSDAVARSWDFGKWVIKNPSILSNCGSGKNNLSTCADQFTRVTVGMKPSSNTMFYEQNATTVVGDEYDAHYLVGNYYQWTTATAGTGVDLASNSVASGSICPKGWRLPATSKNDDDGSISGDIVTLLSAYGITSDSDAIYTNPLYFVRGGIVWQDQDLFAFAGSTTYYWSSTVKTKNGQAYFYTFAGGHGFSLAHLSSFGRAMSVRCVAR